MLNQIIQKRGIYNKYHFACLKKLILLPLALIFAISFCFGQPATTTPPAAAAPANPPATPSNANPPADTSTFTFLNAYNFDVNSLGKSNYLAHINIYSPLLEFNKKKTKFGLNSGIMKISYNSDSSSKVLAFRNITINPRQAVGVGTKYLSQSTNVMTVVSNTAYSLYFQPTYSLTSPESKNKILIHGHMELLIFNLKSTTISSNTQQDSLVYTKADSARHVSVYRGDPADTSAIINKKSVLNGYFGAGLTFDLHPWTNGALFFQPTFGGTTDFPDFRYYLGRTSTGVQKWNWFYLIRAIYTQKLGDHSKIVIGTDIRGIFPQYKPLYSIYAGVSLDISAIAAMFK